MLDQTGGLVTMAMAPYGPEIVGEERALAEWRVARELGLGAPITAMAREAGVPVGLGADTVVSGPDDMFSSARAGGIGRPAGAVLDQNMTNAVSLPAKRRDPYHETA